MPPMAAPRRRRPDLPEEPAPRRPSRVVSDADPPRAPGRVRLRHPRSSVLIEFLVLPSLVSLLVIGTGFALAQAERVPHSANVAEARHEPSPTPRGVDVTVHLRLLNDTGVTRVNLVYCRAENYACAPSLTMNRAGQASFQAPIRWNPGFFRGAQNVGYNFTIRYDDGRNETSPIQNWPYTPPALPEGAGRYYFYPLQGREAAPVPLPGAMLLAAVILVAGAIRRRDPP